MAQTTWTGSDQAKGVLLTDVQANDTELYLTKTEVEAARKVEADLEAKIDAMDASILAVTAANGSLVSSNDTTPGFLDGKLVADDSITLTASGAGDETLTVSVSELFLKSHFLL